MNAQMNPAHVLIPRLTRRRFVAIGGAGLLIMFASVLLQATGLAVWKALAAAGIILMVYGWFRLVVPPYLGLPPMNGGELDERQKTIVKDAYALSYRLVASGLLLVLGYVVLVDIFSALPPLSRMADKSLLLLAVLWTVIGLPAAILAWTEPDLDAPEAHKGQS